MPELTEKQKRVLEYLVKKSTDGLPPTVREICAACGIKSTSSAHETLRVLEEKGYIVREAGYSRAIRLAGAPPARQVPLLGRVTAGQPILAIEQVEEYIPFSGRSAGRELFALRIVGESMIGAGILDGDIVIAERTEAFSDGDIVVVLIEDEATVKRIFRERPGVRLQPENPAFRPMYFDNVQVLGRVIASIRSYE